MAQKVCVFCGSAKSGMTLEHVIPNWISDLFPEPEEGAFSELGIVGQPLRRYPAEIFSQQVRAVCKDCNGRWMSALENSVKPFLGPMISDGRETRLSRHALRNLALWAAKTAFMFDCLHPKARQIPDSDFHALYAAKQPGDNYLIWLGYLGIVDKDDAGHQKIAQAQVESIGRIHVPTSTTEWNRLSIARSRIIGATLAIGRVAIQLLGHNMQKRIGYMRPEGVVSQIWPVEGHVTWPPRYGVERVGGFKGLHDSLKAPPEST